MGLLKFLGLGQPEPVAISAAAGMTAQPLIVGPPAGSQDKIMHAHYRLDAIKRTLEQSGDKLSSAHREEFRMEVRDHCHTLVQLGLMTDDEAQRLIKSGGKV